MEENKVVPLDFWPSSYGMRVKIALAEKGIKYECRQEDRHVGIKFNIKGAIHVITKM